MNLTDKEKQNALNEVRILASIRQPNIIGYKEAFVDEMSNSLWYERGDGQLNFTAILLCILNLLWYLLTSVLLWNMLTMGISTRRSQTIRKKDSSFQNKKSGRYSFKYAKITTYDNQFGKL